MHEISNPFELFQSWLDKATSTKVPEPTEMVLATVDSHHQPNLRTVLFKGFYQGDFTFYTNYTSTKGQEIAQNPQVSLLFYWHKPLEYQVRVQGKAYKLPKEVSEKYFHSRPRQSQLSAWASPQSQKVGSREEMERLVESYDKKFSGIVPLPEFWGGYAVKAHQFDFMILDPYRMHDRFSFELVDGQWVKSRLAP